VIANITDTQRLPRVAKIRLGEKDPSRGFPRATDHFVFTDCPELEELYGPECREIYPVVIPAEDEEAYFKTSLSAYSTAGLFCRCSDGENAIRVNKGLDMRETIKNKRGGGERKNPGFNKPADSQGWAYLEQQGVLNTTDQGAMFEMPCPGAECPYTRRDICKPLGRLFICVMDSPKFGVYEISTTSINTIRNVLSSARYIQATAGKITGIPLALKLVPMQVQPDGKAKTVFVLELEFRDGGIRALMGMRKNPVGLLGEPTTPDDTPSDLYLRGGEAAPAGPVVEGTIPDQAPVNGPATEEPLNSPDDIFSKDVDGEEPPHPAESVVPGAVAKAIENEPQIRAKEAAQAKQRQRRPAARPQPPKAEQPTPKGPSDDDFESF